MREARGMGAIAPEKQPKKVRRKDGCTLDMYAKGGKIYDTQRKNRKGFIYTDLRNQAKR